MEKDQYGNYVTNDTKRFNSEWQAHNHEKELRHEQNKNDAEFYKALGGHKLSNLIFTEWLVGVPGAVMIIAFAVTWNLWLLLFMIGWFVCGGILIYYVKKVSERTRKIAFWSTIVFAVAILIAYKVITAP